MLASTKSSQAVKNSFSPITYQEKITTTPLDSVRFSGGEPVTMKLTMEAMGWLTSFASSKAFDSFNLSQVQKEKLKEAGMPEEYFAGIRALELAKQSNDPKACIRDAMLSFEKAGEKANLETQKAHAYRLAAISAKLVDDTRIAKKFMALSKESRRLACIDKSLSEGPTADTKKIDALEDNISYVTADYKKTLGNIALLGETAGQRLLGKREPLTSKRWQENSMPFNTALSRTKENIVLKHQELDGESSDDEWIQGKDNPASPDRKGLRHEYLSLGVAQVVAQARNNPDHFYTKAVEAVKTLFEASAKYGNARFGDLIYKGEINQAQAFIDAGADVNTVLPDEGGSTPLFVATAMRQIPCVDLLLNRDEIQAEKHTKKDLSPFGSAIMTGDINIVRLFIRSDKIDLNHPLVKGFTPLVLAVDNGETAIVRELLNSKKVDINKKFGDMTPLAIAIRNGHMHIAELLTRAGAKK